MLGKFIRAMVAKLNGKELPGPPLEASSPRPNSSSVRYNLTFTAVITAFLGITPQDLMLLCMSDWESAYELLVKTRDGVSITPDSFLRPTETLVVRRDGEPRVFKCGHEDGPRRLYQPHGQEAIIIQAPESFEGIFDGHVVIDCTDDRKCFVRNGREGISTIILRRSKAIHLTDGEPVQLFSGDFVVLGAGSLVLQVD